MPWLQEPCFCSIVIFVNIVRFPPLRYCQISSTIAETSLYSRFGGGIGKRGSVRQVSSELLQFNSPGQPGRFPRATKKVLACSHSHSLQLLCTVGGNQARLDARTECKILKLSLKGGVEAGRTHRCRRACYTLCW